MRSPLREVSKVPVLPFIDLLILFAWTSLIWAALHKALHLALALQFKVLGLGPFEFVVMAGVSLLFALALAARVWVRANEPDFGDYQFDPEAAEGDAAVNGGSARIS
jgi:hypothetical protein